MAECKSHWLTCADYAGLAGLPLRTARHAVMRAAKGKAVSNRPLTVRQINGRGGRSGVHYEVALSSLSQALQDAFWEAAGGSVVKHAGQGGDASNVPACLDAAPRLMPSKSQGNKIGRVLDAISPALDHPRGSAARAAAIRAAVRPGLALRTLQRFVTEYEKADYDLTRLGRQRPSNAGKRRVWVGDKFDRAYLAAGHDSEQLPHWGARRDQLLKDWWASETQRVGWRRVKLEAETSLRRELAASNIAMPKAVVVISQRAVMALQHFREVDVYRSDRKVWDDGKSRIRRDNAQWLPLQQVVLDVKHLDVVVTRPDGSQVHPKMIAFMDSGTKRMFVHFVFPTKEERGVRQEHVITAFIEMVRHPDWGLPDRIYMDNGSENIKLETVQPLLDMISRAGYKTIVKAKKYSGASKPIESRFSELDRQIFSQMLGYVGGDRMNARRPDLGKKTKPYPHSYEAFEQEVRIRLADFEDQPINSGPFKGRSPREIFVASNHSPQPIDPLALDAHFAEYEERTVDRGSISLRGVRYRRPDLPNGRRVTVAISYRRDAAPLVKLPGGDWAYLEADQLYLPAMSDGAIAAGRAQANDRHRVRDMRREVQPVDQFANIQARSAERVVVLPTAAAPAPLMDVMASTQAHEMAAAWREGERARLDAPSKEDRRRADLMAETEALERYHARKRAG